MRSPAYPIFIQLLCMLHAQTQPDSEEPARQINIAALESKKPTPSWREWVFTKPERPDQNTQNGYTH